MTKKTLQLLASVAVIAGMGLTTVTANAADATVSGTKGTTAKVSLTAGSTSGGDGNTDGDAGGIKLTNVPDIDFGTNTLTGAQLNLTGTLSGNSKNTDTTSTAVTVVNPGVATGWNVQVRNDAMVSGSTGLMASTINLTKSSVTGNGGDTTGAPTFNTVSLNSEGTANTVVATAAENEGVGTWDMKYADPTMTVNPRNIAGDYSTNLTWTISNAPTGTTAAGAGNTQTAESSSASSTSSAN